MIHVDFFIAFFGGPKRVVNLFLLDYSIPSTKTTTIAILSSVYQQREGPAARARPCRASPVRGVFCIVVWNCTHPAQHITTTNTGYMINMIYMIYIICMICPKCENIGGRGDAQSKSVTVVVPQQCGALLDDNARIGAEPCTVTGYWSTVLSRTRWWQANFTILNWGPPQIPH